MPTPAHISREQILAHRRRVGGLQRRVPRTPATLAAAAHAGLQDSMPRAALLSLHARLDGIGPDGLDDPTLIQVWGPRYSCYVIAAADRAVFTLGRLPEDARGRERAERMADGLAGLLDGASGDDRRIGAQLGVHPNALRYATTTGRVQIRWDGARAPAMWIVPAPDVDPAAPGRNSRAGTSTSTARPTRRPSPSGPGSACAPRGPPTPSWRPSWSTCRRRSAPG